MKADCAELHLCIDSLTDTLDADNPLVEPGLHPAVADRLIELAKRSNGKAFHIIIENRGDMGGAAELPQAIHSHFQREVDSCSQRIRENFRYARRATLAGLGVIAVFLGIAAELPEEGGRWISVMRESLTIFGWVTMWRPAELWLYDHLPERRLRSVAERLAVAEVSVK